MNQTFLSTKSERLSFDTPPTVEHIMPQGWIANWPLPDGSKGLDLMSLIAAPEGDPQAIATRAREAAIQTLGNLTILSSGLNSAQSNLGWSHKRPELMKHSLLPINQNLAELPHWDEASIRKRGEVLYSRATQIWRR